MGNQARPTATTEMEPGMKEAVGIVLFVTGLGVLVDVFQAPSALAGLVGIPTIGWSLLVCGLGILVAALVTSLADSMAPPAGARTVPAVAAGLPLGSAPTHRLATPTPGRRRTPEEKGRVPLMDAGEKVGLPFDASSPAVPLLITVVTTQDVVASGITGLLSGRRGDFLIAVAGPECGEPDVVFYDVIGLHEGDGADLDQWVAHPSSTVIAVTRELRPELGAAAIQRGAAAAISLGASRDDFLR